MQSDISRVKLTELPTEWRLKSDIKRITPTELQQHKKNYIKSVPSAKWHKQCDINKVKETEITEKNIYKVKSKEWPTEWQYENNINRVT